MAVMNIRIEGVPIDLIGNLKETSNACVTVFEFDIISTVGASITIDARRVADAHTDYDKLEVFVNSWVTVNNDTHTFTIPSSGKATVRLTIGNSVAQRKYVTDEFGNRIVDGVEYSCNSTEITITDNTNGKAESKMFGRCNESPRCSTEEETKPELTIENNTNVYIYFDSSGSMDDTLAPLQTMRDTILKDALLPYYDNDETKYNNRVKIISEPNERTLYMLDIQNQTPTDGKIISLVFQDEAQNSYHEGAGWTTGTTRTPTWDSDLTALINRLDSYPAEHYRGVLFQIETGGDAIFQNFKALWKANKYGTDNYSGDNGLSKREEFNYKFGVKAIDTPENYKNLIISALEELGFTI